MGKDDTIKWAPEGERGSEEDPQATKIQKGDTESPKILQLTKVDSEEEEGATAKTEDTSAFELEGEPFNPIKSFSVLALVDVAQKVKRIRKIPVFVHMKKPVTVIGNSKKANFKVDDFETVRPEHGAVVFRDGRFRVFPLEGSVEVNGESVGEDGEILQNGSRIEMGSAKFLFLTVM